MKVTAVTATPVELAGIHCAPDAMYPPTGGGMIFGGIDIFEKLLKELSAFYGDVHVHAPDELTEPVQ